jgi:uncharacterized protein
MKNRCRSVIRVLLVFLSLTLFFTAVISCQKTEKTSPPSPTPQQEKLFIWKISSESNEVYLLGSVHVASQDIYPLDNTIENAYESSDYLVTEVNINDVDETEILRMMLEYGQYPEGESLSDNLPEALVEKIDERLQESGFSLQQLNTFRPWVVYIFTGQGLSLGAGYEIEYGIDLHFMKKAGESGKTILELETADYQFSLLSSLSDEFFIEAIQYSIENPAPETPLDELFKAWSNGDIEKMEYFTFEPLINQPGLAPFYEAVFDQRNLAMAEKLQGYLSDNETYFIVVGAGHLVGENGLINLMNNQGYEVEQLTKSGG